MKSDLPVTREQLLGWDHRDKMQNRICYVCDVAGKWQGTRVERAFYPYGNRWHVEFVCMNCGTEYSVSNNTNRG